MPMCACRIFVCMNYIIDMDTCVRVCLHSPKLYLEELTLTHRARFAFLTHK
jgi:hypothetical protein